MRAPFFVITIVLLIASVEANTCKVEPRDRKTCQALAFKNCGPGVTSSYNKCRSIYTRWCQTPEVIESVTTCLAIRAETATAPGHSNEETRRICRNGLTQQCIEQSAPVCALQGAVVEVQPIFIQPPPPPPCPPKKDLVVDVPLPRIRMPKANKIFRNLKNIGNTLEKLSFALALKGFGVDRKCDSNTPVLNTQTFEKFQWPKLIKDHKETKILVRTKKETIKQLKQRLRKLKLLREKKEKKEKKETKHKKEADHKKERK